jgi:hypothetical protein
VRQRKVYERVERLKGGWTNVYDARSTRPSIVICVKIKGRSISVFGTTEESALMKLHLKQPPVTETNGERISEGQMKTYVVVIESGNLAFGTMLQ